MWGVFGLGNPGARYTTTRHNVGLLVVELLAVRAAAVFRRHEGYWCAAIERAGAPVVLVKPSTYVNRSRAAPCSAWVNYCAGWTGPKAALPSRTDSTSSRAFPIRGHQLGYRHTANSYDGWDDRQFEQYIRELALFGINSIEGIPFQDDRKSPHMPLPRDVMNRKLSEICARYELAYWVWVPADFDLKDSAKRAQHLDRHEAFFRDCPRLDALFFPGGDPGDNPPQLVMPFLADLARLLQKYHPRAKVW